MDQILNVLNDIFPMVFILTLAILIGIEVISKVPTVLHTPLMSGANAISGVTIIGGILIVRRAASDEYFMLVIGTLAIVFAMLNVIGGFKVTDRMLAMFKRKK
jgi:NAD(P) transhydrogenase subunit alpha